MLRVYSLHYTMSYAGHGRAVRRKVHVQDEAKRDRAQIWASQIYSRNFVKSRTDAYTFIDDKPVGCYVFFGHGPRYGMLLKRSETQTIEYDIIPNRDYTSYTTSTGGDLAKRYMSINGFLNDLDPSGKDYDMIRDVEMQTGSRTRRDSGDSHRIGSDRALVISDIPAVRSIHQPRVRDLRAEGTPASCQGGPTQGYGLDGHSGALTKHSAVSREPRTEARPTALHPVTRSSLKYVDSVYAITSEPSRNGEPVGVRMTRCTPRLESGVCGATSTAKVQDMLRAMSLSERERDCHGLLRHSEPRACGDVQHMGHNRGAVYTGACNYSDGSDARTYCKVDTGTGNNGHAVSADNVYEHAYTTGCAYQGSDTEDRDYDDADTGYCYQMNGTSTKHTARTHAPCPNLAEECEEDDYTFVHDGVKAKDSAYGGGVAF